MAAQQYTTRTAVGAVLTMSRTPTLVEAKRLQRCDQWYGLCAVMVLIVGFLRVVYFEKGMPGLHGALLG